MLPYWISQNTTVGNVKIGQSLTTSLIQGLYTYGITGRAASQAWLGMGGQVIGVRGVPGLNRGGGGTPFDSVSFKWDGWKGKIVKKC